MTTLEIAAVRALTVLLVFLISCWSACLVIGRLPLSGASQSLLAICSGFALGVASVVVLIAWSDRP